ncbi:NAD-dependent succinate-semialdehyde dehydrogenase [Nesterenkonia xinjiangensis]|uniref:Succinate-semialdehyde dehydrogenase/glutarate-semialdehyde dehydrogenase n=1 Tax=Nesterenkonia xinjiangensis TaxID=225327 RepID=A0A7Z0KAD6_9MICC|nr:NAD-dependent succinate-semialdehyde dehydrogenase [Nesterenkonia xinjiangensis]NYJ78738.1 succinate-semialdehyde dehydrogenase/glutarate-semialdehyde dehydrogenase [Nesterenkonia xinjiangensis]
MTETTSSETTSSETTSSETTRLEYRTRDPRTNTVLETFDVLEPAQLEEVLEVGHQAFQDWRTLDIEDRAVFAHRIADLFEERRTDLAVIASTEMGKALDQADGEVQECIDIFRYYAVNGPHLGADEVIKEIDGRRAVIQKRPLGMLLGIMPWNFPFYQVARFAAPNLLLGNTLLLKHTESCPRSALALQRLLDDAGLPAGVYQNVFVTHDQVEQIIADDRVQGVSLTGSERAGSAVASLAGRHLKKVVLELGGSDPHIYLSAEDVAQAAREAVEFRLDTMGQACTSNKRLIVLEDLYEEFVDAVVEEIGALEPGDPLEPRPGHYYPLSSEQAAEGLHGQLRRAVEQGARLRVGGDRPDRPGAWLRPAVLTDVSEHTDAYRQELFGPVLTIYRVRDEEEAVRLANDSSYGLGGAVFSQDRAQALRVAQQLEVGMSNVNVGGSEAADMPFGGVKRSGFGRELGPLGMDEFVNKRLLNIVDPEIAGREG